MRTNVYKIAAFVWRNYPVCREWGAGMLVNFLAWHLNRQSLFLVVDDDENIVGVAAARTVMEPEDGAHNGVLTETEDPEGRIVFIDLAVTAHPVALKILVIKLRQRFGVREAVAYIRYPDPKVRVRNFGQFRDALLRKELV